jgi:hypothetical protein
MDWFTNWLSRPAFPQSSMYSAPAPLPPNPYAAPGGTGAGVAAREYPSLGQSLTGNTGGGAPVPLPQPRPEAAGPGGQVQRTALGAPGPGGLQQGLAGALRGVQTMQPPAAQTVRTPPPPALRPIEAGQLINTLASLGIKPQDLPRLGIGR